MCPAEHKLPGEHQLKERLYDGASERVILRGLFCPMILKSEDQVTWNSDDS